MQSSSYELSTPVADRVYVNIYLKNPFTYAEIDNSSEVIYPTDEKLGGFRFQREASCMSSHNEEL